MHLADLNDVTHGEALKRKATKKHVLTNVTRPYRMPFCPQRVQHLQTPQTKSARWAAVMFQVALTIAKATVCPDRKNRDRGFGHATFGSGMKRGDARFGNHRPHSA